MKIRRKRASGKTRSQIVREYLRSLPSGDRSPTAVAEAMKARGVTVTRNLVSVVKSSMARESDPAQDGLMIAKKLLQAAGDAQRAKEMVEVVARILS